jgi:hypothetical protein
MKLYIFSKKEGKNKHFFHMDKNYLGEILILAVLKRHLPAFQPIDGEAFPQRHNRRISESTGQGLCCFFHFK